jgi:hypothetical protein
MTDLPPDHPITRIQALLQGEPEDLRFFFAELIDCGDPDCTHPRCFSADEALERDHGEG